MACVRRVEELSTDPNFVGYYDIEEARRQDIEDSLEENVSLEVISRCISLSIDEIKRII